MKRILLNVSAIAALAVGWIGGDGLASSSGLNSDARRTAEIASLSFTNDTEILRVWQDVQQNRQTRQQENQKIAGKIEAQKNEILRVERRLEELKEAIKDSRTSLENEKSIQAALEWHQEAGRLLPELDAFKQRVDAHDWIHRNKWQETEGRLAGFVDLDFKGKIQLREEVLGVQKEFIEELAGTYEKYSNEFDGLRKSITSHLENLDPPPP